MKSTEIRERFLKFFENYHHQRVKSSSLIPAADPTLLFTNAGMVQFKDCFLGLTDLGFKRATTSQKCVRAGGKHNDLENVGFTPRHHTFFEMLGNFSFGDYFKKDAIAFAWELLTRHYGIPQEKLRVTVFKEDDEAYDLWKAIGVPESRIGRLGEKDNFWAMGDTGPCGPCTEIYFDWGVEKGCGKPDCAPGCACDTRFLEIWNLVFMQFNRDSSGKLHPLPKPSVDTGSGLERVAAVLQGVYSNYDTDLFQPIITAIAKRAGKKYGANGEDDVSMRVIADHLRSGTFLISDGVNPSNEGRGYVLRRILRRAIRHGKKLGLNQPFINELVSSVTASLGSVYPEIEQNRKVIELVIREEEERFHETLDRGMGLLEETIRKVVSKKENAIPGDIAFKLYDTFGFPLDLIEVIAKERNLSVDESEFQKLMEKQRSQSVWKGGQSQAHLEPITKAVAAAQLGSFTGYEATEGNGKLLYLFDDNGQPVDSLRTGQSGFAIFDSTPFYAESGGQVGDKGMAIEGANRARILNTNKIAKQIVQQLVIEAGTLTQGKTYQLKVDARARQLTAINHTATHMLHAALRKTLGERVKQAGSLVDPDRLRFDFTFPRAIEEKELKEIEKIINEKVRASLSVSVKEMAYDDAIKAGALAFFDEKYGDKVRVVKVAGDDEPFSVELCGGTHLKNSSEIGFFKIVSESSVASGVRRIEAITSDAAIQHLLDRHQWLNEVESALQAKGDQAVKKLETILTENRNLQRQVSDLKLKVAQGSTSQQALHDKARTVRGLKVVNEVVPGADAKILRSLVDQIRDKLKEKTVVVLATESEGKAALCVGITKDLTATLDAVKVIKELAPEVGGTGGGRPDFAQAGGNNPGGIPNAFAKIDAVIEKLL